MKVDGATIEIKAYLGHLIFPTAGLSSLIDVVESMEDCCFRAKTGGGSRVIFHESL